MDISNFASPLPYPSLDGIHPNSRDLQAIREDYSGIISELSAITQYVYHQLYAKEEGDTSVGSTLLSIAQIEMRHLNLLGSAILKLGGDPRFIYQEDCHLVYWNGSVIDHSTQIQQMLVADIVLERKTIACYIRQANATCQPALAALLRRIVLDEEIHISILQGLLDGISPEG